MMHIDSSKGVYMKTIVLLGLGSSQSVADFQQDHLGVFAKTVECRKNVKQYVINLVKEPTQTLMDAGWGWGGEDDSGVVAFDELWSDDHLDISAMYEGENVIGAYEVDEVILKASSYDWPAHTKSPWIKRIGLLKCFSDQRPEDFHAYWKKNHGEIALTHHIGTSAYKQNHIIEALKEAPVEWNGIVMLSYWNEDAFKYGHFPREDSLEIVKEDGSHFMEVFRAFYAEEYVIKSMKKQPQPIATKTIVL